MIPIRIEIPKFMTHIRKSKNKFVKINGQKLFVGMDHHLRSLIVRKMHDYLKQYIPEDLDLRGMYPLRIKLEFHAPVNYDHARLLIDKHTKKPKYSWKKPEFWYEPGWDADNQWIWGKCFNDTLVEMGIIDNDCVKIIRSAGEVEFIPSEDLDSRKLVFVISKYEEPIQPLPVEGKEEVPDWLKKD